MLELKDGPVAIGSGGNYALTATWVMIDSKYSAEEIAKKSIDFSRSLYLYK